MTDEQNLATQTPAQLDEQWGQLIYATAVAEARLASAQRGADKGYTSNQIEAAQKRLADAEAAYDDARHAEKPYSAEWARRGGWTRAWLCTSATQGHIHRTHHCPSLRPTSQLGLVYTLSGHDETEIVAAAGETACTKCFPSAPAGEGIASAAQRAMQLAEAATNARRAAPYHQAKADELVGHADRLAALDVDQAAAYIDEHNLRSDTGRIETKRNVTSAVRRLRKRAAERQAMADEARQKIADADAAGITEDYRPGLVPAFNKGA